MAYAVSHYSSDLSAILGWIFDQTLLFKYGALSRSIPTDKGLVLSISLGYDQLRLPFELAR